jgi:hypothetical protein
MEDRRRRRWWRGSAVAPSTEQGWPGGGPRTGSKGGEKVRIRKGGLEGDGGRWVGGAVATGRGWWRRRRGWCAAGEEQVVGPVLDWKIISLSIFREGNRRPRVTRVF